MDTSNPTLSDDATDAMETYLDELIDVVRLANGAYDDISTEDIVAVLRHHAELYETHGVDGVHPRNQTDDTPSLAGTLRQTDDETIESTDRRWFNVDVGFKTGLMHGSDLTDDQRVTVLSRMADFIEEHGRTVVGSRDKRTE